VRQWRDRPCGTFGTRPTASSSDRRVAGGHTHAGPVDGEVCRGAEVDRELALQRPNGHCTDLRVREPGHCLTGVEPGHRDAQPVQGLAELQANGAEPDYRDGARQVLQVEQTLRGEQALAQGAKGTRNQGPRAGGDHHPADTHASAPIRFRSAVVIGQVPTRIRGVISPQLSDQVHMLVKDRLEVSF
jgi:hypothetical protein